MKIYVHHHEQPWVYEPDLDKGALRLVSWPSIWGQYVHAWEVDEEGRFLPFDMVSDYLMGQSCYDEYWDWVPDQ